MYNLTVGADPELFLRKGSKIISAIGLIGGTKQKPKPMVGMADGFAIQEDNVLVEFNIPPAHSASGLCTYIKEAIKYVSTIAESNKLMISKKASASLADDQLMNPAAHIFGCDPDFNVWTLEPNPRPYSEDPNLRSAGGHIHVGCQHFSDTQKIMLGRWLDFLVGIPLACVDPDVTRMQLYGKPGAVRFKPYGLEYRSPSNYWIFKPNPFKYNIWGAIERAIYNVENDTRPDFGMRIIEAWEKGDKDILNQFTHAHGYIL